MGEASVRRAPLVNQLALLLMGILIVYLVVDFGRQVIVSRQIQHELAAIEWDIEQAQVRTEGLQRRLAWARSPGAAEAWAREQGWTQPDEVTIDIVAREAAPTPAVEVVAHQELSLNSARDAWWDLFFGNQ